MLLLLCYLTTFSLRIAHPNYLNRKYKTKYKK